jgi:hypothetical protein
MSTQQRTEQQTIQFLLQLDDGQAVDAGNGGEFAAAMNVMFEHMPDDPLERDCHLSLSRRSQPHYQQRIERGDQHLNGRYRSMHGFKTISRVHTVCDRHGLVRNLQAGFYRFGVVMADPRRLPAPRLTRAWDEIPGQL